MRRAYKHNRILIFSDSQAALKALISPKVTSGLVAECLDALSALASQNEVTVAWGPGHCGIPANEKADKLAKQGAAMPLVGPQPALGMHRCSAREVIKNWTERQYHAAWEDSPGQRHGKLFLSRPCKKRAENLLRLSRHQLTMVVAFLTGHAPLRKHLHIVGLFDGDPTCRFCRMETETVHHIICCCEALAHQHYKFFGKLFAEPKRISTTSLKYLYFSLSDTGLVNLC
jgi:hypothetical protein